MKNIIVLSLYLLFLTAAHSQTSDDYALEIWSAELFNKDGFDFLELDVYNNGPKMDNPKIQIFYDDVSIGNMEKNLEDSLENVILKPLSIHKFELPVEIPSNYDGKKIKLEIVIKHESYQLKKKLKVKIKQ